MPQGIPFINNNNEKFSWSDGSTYSNDAAIFPMGLPFVYGLECELSVFALKFGPPSNAGQVSPKLGLSPGGFLASSRKEFKGELGASNSNFY